VQGKRCCGVRVRLPAAVGQPDAQEQCQVTWRINCSTNIRGGGRARVVGKMKGFRVLNEGV
jgi:hypothetical protein